MRSWTAWVLAGAIVASGNAFAQGVAGPTTLPPPSSAARDPISLPGDNLPPPLAVVLAQPRAANPGTAPAADPPLPPSPPLTLALQAAQAALARCHANGFEVGTAVSNASGVIVLGMQADAAHPGRVYNAMRKNLVALEFGVANSAVRDRLRANDFATLARVKPSMTLFPGAVPLFSRGKLLGAIAVSGGPGGEADEACALAGAEAIRDKLAALP